MPWLATPRFWVAGDCWRWAERASGQRALPFVVAAWPSVMLSPRVTMVAAEGVDWMSISERLNQCSILLGLVKVGAET